MTMVSEYVMKTTKWFGLAAMLAVPTLSGVAQTAEMAAAGAAERVQAAAPANLSPNAAEVLKLASSGVGEDVVLAFVQNSQSRFNLSADDVLYLRDVGVPEPVITAMLNRDNALGPQEAPSQPAQYAPAPTEPAPAAAEAAAPTPAPATTAQAVTPAPAYVASPPEDVTYFYNDLAPYGTWVSLAGVGWCWQPTVVVVNRGWRPYCHGGNWVYTDAGWFWRSDYSWGWAPFHYGRWYMDASCGWVWVPGRVWAPAWVTWRSVGTTCGWAPLPPGADFVAGIGWRYNGFAVAANFTFGLGVDAFAFVSFNNFCANNLSYHCLPPAHVRGIYHQTTIINNFAVVNNVYVNRGIAVERIGAASRAPVPRAALRDTQRGEPRPRGATGTEVYRTQLGKPEPSRRMVAQKVDPSRPRIDHAVYRPTSTSRSHLQGTGGTRSGSPAATPASRPQTVGRPATDRRGATVLMQPAAGKPSQGHQTVSPGSGSSGSPSGVNRTHHWQGTDKPASTPQTAPASRDQPGSGSRPPTKASSGTQPTATSPAQSSGSPTISRPTSNPHGSSASGVYPGSGAAAGARSPSGYQAPSPAPVSPSSTSGGQRPAVRAPRDQGSISSSGSAAQRQPTAVQSTRRTANPHFYTPKTPGQAYPSRSLSPQPGASARPSGSPDYNSRRNR